MEPKRSPRRIIYPSETLLAASCVLPCGELLKKTMGRGLPRNHLPRMVVSSVQQELYKHLVKSSCSAFRLGDPIGMLMLFDISKGNNEKARCVYCGTDFGIGHGGRSDVKRHVETEGHRNAVVDAKQTGRQVRLSEMRYPPRANATLVEKVARAEALWCKFVSEHNLPFAV